jgi:AraC-like DNA-binding protein
MVRGDPAPALRGHVSAYYGFREETPRPVRRREGPGLHAIVLVSFGETWSINGKRVESFAAGLHGRQVTTEHRGRSFGIQVDLSPPAAYVLFREPMHELAHRVVPLEEVFGEPLLAERLHERADWADRFALLDSVLARRLGDAPAPSSEISWAWHTLLQTGGRMRVAALATELGWSRKRIAARFREEVGLAPKAAARLIRFERARESAERSERRDWARIALEYGYYDQSHLINDFREVTGRSPETFFQDARAGAD